VLAEYLGLEPAFSASITGAASVKIRVPSQKAGFKNARNCGFPLVANEIIYW
jgi:hypothetical protein